MKKKLILIAVLGILVFVLPIIVAVVSIIVNVATTSQDFRIIAVAPSNGKEAVGQSDPVLVFFDKSLPQLDIFTITTNPSVEGQYVRNEQNKTVGFIPNRGFVANTRYSVSFSFKDNRMFLAPDRKKSSQYTWSFSTGEQAGETGFTETEIQEYQKLQEEAVNSYEDRKRRLPFIVHVPYQTSTFKVEIASTSDTVTITTFGTNSQSHLEYREQARVWLRGTGTNVDTLNIVYSPTSP